MFVRSKKKANGNTSVQIVANMRTGDKVKQRILRHVGVATNDAELAKLQDLAAYIKASLEEEQQPSLLGPDEMAEAAIQYRKHKQEQADLQVNISELSEESRSTVGIHEVCGTVYDELGFDKLFSARSKSARKYLRNIVMARIASPSSKLASTERLREEFGIRLNLDMVYRMMDQLDDHEIDKIKDLSYQQGKLLLGEKFDVLFYDATTLYFESRQEDDLRAKGYSKDMKFNKSQVLLAVMVSSDGIPMGYELFPGNMYEGKTLSQAMDRLRARYDIGEVYVVADSGLLSQENQDYLDRHGYKYILGARLKNMGAEVKPQVLDLASYTQMGEKKYKEVDLGKRKIVCHYCPVRARKDQHDREKAVNKLVKKLQRSKQPGSLISNQGYKKYVQLEGAGQVVLDQEKIAQDAAWDGICGVITNDKQADISQVLQHYRGLWQVEETFRLSKHDLRVRPIFHWSERRIKAHIAICYMALVCIRHLEYRVAAQYKKLSPKAIIRHLCRVQVSILRHRQDRFCLPAKSSEEAAKIYKIITGRKPPTTPFTIK